MLILGTIITLSFGVLPGLLYIPLLVGNPKRTSANIIKYGLLAGIAAGIGILLFKSAFFKQNAIIPSRETLTLTLFVSFIEAGLLEECFKNALYLFAHRSLKGKVDFQVRPYSIFALGAAVGLGFALLENAYYALNPNLGQISVVLGRVYTTFPAHMIMNVLFAYLHHKKVNVLLALMASIAFHALYDFFALPSTILGTILVKATVIVGICFVLSLARALWKEENACKTNKIHQSA